jgi:hypothetical protein
MPSTPRRLAGAILQVGPAKLAEIPELVLGEVRRGSFVTSCYPVDGGDNAEQPRSRTFVLGR